MIENITCTQLDLPDNYVPVTYAYDLMNSQRHELVREVRRLEKKGESCVVKWWDNRAEEHPRTEVGHEKYTVKGSVWGEIWKEKK